MRDLLQSRCSVGEPQIAQRLDRFKLYLRGLSMVAVKRQEPAAGFLIARLICEHAKRKRGGRTQLAGILLPLEDQRTQTIQRSGEMNATERDDAVVDCDLGLMLI